MRQFTHIDASSVNEASGLLSAGSMLIAGGTDLIGVLKDEILPTYPNRVVNLKTVPDLYQIVQESDGISIGALVTLDVIAKDEEIRANYTCLAEAAARTSAATQRKMGTLGGNICQMHRCWYFRAPDNLFECLRKGGKSCPASIGEGRNHSIFGAEQGCIAASPHDTAPALIALDATFVTNKGEYAAEEFFAVNGVRSNVLQDGEILTSVKIPNRGWKSAFIKFADRKAIDFPIVNCAVAQSSEGVRIACGGVYPTPLRMTAAEEAVSGGITESSAEAAGEAAVADAQPLAKSAYKVAIAKSVIKKTLLALA